MRSSRSSVSCHGLKLCVVPSTKKYRLVQNIQRGWFPFCSWMKEKHSCDLICQAERECKGCRNVVLIMSIAIYWNHKCCVTFLDKTISYCGREHNILATNQMIMLNCVGMVAVACMWAILYLLLLSPLRWLAGKTKTLCHQKWGYILMSKVLDKLKNDLETIVYLPELIHNQNCTMGLMTKSEVEFPEFKCYVHNFIKHNKTFHFNALGRKKAYPMK